MTWRERKGQRVTVRERERGGGGRRRRVIGDLKKVIAHVLTFHQRVSK